MLSTKMSFSRLRAWSIVFVALYLVASPAASAENVDSGLTVIPTEVQIPEGKTANVVVLLENNTSGATLDNARITAFSNPPFDIQVEPKAARAVPENGVIVWTSSVGAPGLSAASGAVVFRMDCMLVKSGKKPPIPITRVASLKIAGPELQPVADIVEVKIETPIESINEKRSGRAYVIVTNKTDVRVTVQPFSARALDNLKIKSVPTDSAGYSERTASKAPPLWVRLRDYLRGQPMVTPSPKPALSPSPSSSPKPIIVNPHASQAIAFDVSASGVVTPGKELLVFDVPVTWEKNGVPYSATVLATHEIPVGVFGESAILTAIGLPSFLFLPGFLMMTTFGLLRKHGQPETSDAKFDFTWNAGGVVVISISLSILAAFLYPLITRLVTGVSRNYTVAYDVADVCAVWFGSIVLGGLAYAIVKTAKDWQTSAYEFSERDRPLDVLKKIARKGLKLKLPTPNNDPSKTTVVLDRVRSALDKSWVTPLVLMDWHQGSERDEAKTKTAINEDNAKQVAKLLKRADRRKKVGLSWKRPGASGLNMVETSSIEPLGPVERILEDA